MHTPVYLPELWVLVRERKTVVCAACGIADFEPETEELILEWIQMLPGFRGRGLGQALVNTLLARGAARAAFATVSGRVDKPGPSRGHLQKMRLYRAGYMAYTSEKIEEKAPVPASLPPG